MLRRQFLLGLFAAPAVIAASSLMPLRGIVIPILTPAQRKLIDGLKADGIWDSCECLWVPHVAPDNWMINLKQFA